MRRSIGSANRRRIISTRSRSLSRLSAASLSLRTFRFRMCLLQDFQYRPVPRAPGRRFAPDDVCKRRDHESGISDSYSLRACFQPRKRWDTVDGRQEIELQAVVIAHDAKEVGHRVVRAQHDGAETSGEIFQLAHVHGCLPEHEIEVHGRDWRAL